ncbi:hypothetical protein L873DRAFT_1846822 [Choiromyces venosus 120613-1]|uniref:Uncharacterized protein n=1 Tax=Choiromyces venosus 120613-1 TaxID=1336337 RepID=A0A3N4J704_9PEZI|nr:hypothetical protein L873DRAFT_1846822 [Choiromyces venosus 120613-1]
MPIDGGAGLLSTARCGRPDATVGVVKQSASGTGTSALVPLPEGKRKFIKTSASTDIDETCLLPNFLTGLGGKTGTQNEFEDNLDSLNGFTMWLPTGRMHYRATLRQEPKISHKRKYFQELEKQQSMNNSYEFLDGRRRSVDGRSGKKNDALCIPISQLISFHAVTSGFSWRRRGGEG